MLNVAFPVLLCSMTRHDTRGVLRPHLRPELTPLPQLLSARKHPGSIAAMGIGAYLFGALSNCDELCSVENQYFCSLSWALFVQWFADIDENVVSRQDSLVVTKQCKLMFNFVSHFCFRSSAYILLCILAKPALWLVFSVKMHCTADVIDMLSWLMMTVWL